MTMLKLQEQDAVVYVVYAGKTSDDGMRNKEQHEGKGKGWACNNHNMHKKKQGGVTQVVCCVDLHMYITYVHIHVHVHVYIIHMHLYIEEMELYWVIAVDILISKEELLSESEDDRAA